MYRDELNEIHSEIDDIKSRLDSICNAMNTNIASLQSIVSAMQNNDYVKSITPVIQNGVEIGYEIVFSKSGKITIYHGKDGSSSVGTDGKDGHTPVIGVKQDADGVWYWTVDGTWLLDTNGNKVKAVGQDGQDGEDGKDGQDGEDGKDGQDGEDGKDGQDGEDGKDGQDGEDGKDGQDGQDGTDGKDGKDGVTPQLKIVDGYWYVSYDNGTTWEPLNYKASGSDGSNGDAFFKDVDTSDEYSITFTLANGQKITIPTQKAHDELEARVTKLEENVASISTILEVLKNNDYVTGTTPIKENGEVVGYEIQFAKSEPIQIYYGKDGADGTTPELPSLTVKKDDTYGLCWWYGDDYVRDANGKPVRAEAQDGISTRIEIRNGDEWWIDEYGDGGWEYICKATGDSFFKAVNPVYETNEQGEEVVAYILIEIYGAEGEIISYEIPTQHTINELEKKIDALQEQFNSLNALVNSLTEKQYIKEIVEIYGNSPQIIGYEITLVSLIIEDGKFVEKLSKKEVLLAPTTGAVGLKYDEKAGIYYWTINGQELKDNDGNRIPASGENKKLPRVRIQNKFWEFLIDGETDWIKTNIAAEGEGNPCINGVEKIGDGYKFWLSDGSSIEVPSWEAFEKLQRTVTEIETSIESIITFIEGNDGQFITDVTTKDGIITISYRTYDFEKNIWGDVQTKDLSTNPYITVQMVDGVYHWFAGDTDLGKVDHNVPTVKYEDGKLMVSTEDGKWIEFDITHDNTIVSVEPVYTTVGEEQIIEKYIIKLKGGATIEVPSYASFQALKAVVEEIQKQLGDFKNLFDEKTFVTSVEEKDGVFTIKSVKFEGDACVAQDPITIDPRESYVAISDKGTWVIGGNDTGIPVDHNVPTVKYEDGKLMVSTEDGKWTEFEITHDNSIVSVDPVMTTVGEEQIIEKYIIKLKGGATIEVPSYASFQALKAAVEQIKEELGAFKKLFDEKTFVTSVEENNGVFTINSVKFEGDACVAQDPITINLNETFVSIQNGFWVIGGNVTQIPIDHPIPTITFENNELKVNGETIGTVQLGNSDVKIEKGEDSLKFTFGDDSEPIEVPFYKDLAITGLGAAYWIRNSSYTIEVGYTGATGTPNAYIICENGWSAKASVDTDPTNKKITITVTRPFNQYGISDGNMVIFLNNSGRVAMAQTRLTANYSNPNTSVEGGGYVSNVTSTTPRGFYLGSDGGTFTITASNGEDGFDLSDVEIEIEEGKSTDKPKYQSGNWPGSYSDYSFDDREKEWLNYVQTKASINYSITAKEWKKTSSRDETKRRRAMITLKLGENTIGTFDVFQSNTETFTSNR